jgi:hypothetical protein
LSIGPARPGPVVRMSGPSKHLARVDSRAFPFGDMTQVSRRTGFTSSALIRMLARLAELDATESKQALADRLSQWLGWTDAISLSTALNGSPAAPLTRPSVARAFANVEEEDCVRVRITLMKVIVEDNAVAPRHFNVPGRSASNDEAADFSAHRRRYVAWQHAMEASIGPLRGRLRAALAARSAEMARLAAVDAVMERALGPHERRLLSTVPALLESHFARARHAEHAQVADLQASDGGLDLFQRDMQAVLLAELDIRLQPAEGLLAALRMK